MKRAEPKNGVWDSTRSILVNAAIDRRNMTVRGHWPSGYSHRSPGVPSFICLRGRP